MLSMQHVYKSYGRHEVIRDFNLEVETGEIVGLIGENGAGKSTVLKILTTLLKPTKGEVYLDGKSYKKHYKKIRPKIGYVPQDIALWEDLTVIENMKFFSKLSTVKRSTEELKNIVESVSLDRFNTKVSDLSGGMKRKLNLAVSLIHNPELLLLDEPTVGIDLKSRIEIGKHLKRLSTEENKTIIYISHDMNEIESICDRVVVIGSDEFYRTILKTNNENASVQFYI